MSSSSPARIKISAEEAEAYEPPKFRSTNTLKELIDQLSSDTRSDKEKSNAALAIQYLSLNAEKAVSIVHMPHAVRGLAELLNSGSDEARQHAAGAIAHLAVNDEAELAISSTPGVLDALGTLLWNGNEEAKQEAAAALENVSYSTTTARMVSKIEEVIDGLAQLLCTGTTMGKERAVGALQNLAVLSECRVRIATAPGALKGLASLLWTGSPKAQQDAAATIGNLAVSPEVREAVGRTDGVMEGLVMLLEGESEKGKSDAAAAIGNLAVNADLRNELLELPRIMLGLRSMLVDGPEKHAGEAACCLQNLAVTTVEKKMMIAETPDLLLGLINLMIRCKPQSQYHEDSCSALLNLVVGCSENKKSVAAVPGVFEALGRCMVSGSDRTKEHAVAILQNLAFHSHTNRAIIVKSPTVIDGINFLIHHGPDKASEYAAATTGALARSEPGCRAVLNSRGLLEGLMAMAQRSTPSSGLLKAAVTALFSLARCHAVSAVLIREAVVENALLPVLEACDSTEAGKRIAVQAAVGIAHLGRAQTLLLDLFPSAGLDVLLEAANSALPAGRAAGGKIHLIDLLQALFYIASQDEHKSYLAQKGLPKILVDVLQGEAAAKDPPLLLEALKLTWQMGFDETARTVFLDTGVTELLRDQNQGNPPDWQAVVASDGLHWLLADGPGQVLAPGVDWDGGEPEHAPEDEGHELERSHGSRLILILDPSDFDAARPFMENLKLGGHWMWPRTADTPPVISISDFAAGLYDAQVALLFMSSACEINPSCRSQILQAKTKGISLLPLRVNPSYTPHGHLAFIQGVINCPPSAADGGRSSSLLKMVRSVAPRSEPLGERRVSPAREPSYTSPVSGSERTEDASSSRGREMEPEPMPREVDRTPGAPRSRRDQQSPPSASRSLLGDPRSAAMSPFVPPARSPEPAVQAPINFGPRGPDAATATVPSPSQNFNHSAASQTRPAMTDIEQQTSARSGPLAYNLKEPTGTSTAFSRGTDSRGTDAATATSHRGTDAATATTHRGTDVATERSGALAYNLKEPTGTSTAFSRGTDSRGTDVATATTHRGTDAATVTTHRGTDVATERSGALAYNLKESTAFSRGTDSRGTDVATATTHRGTDAATGTPHQGGHDMATGTMHRGGNIAKGTEGSAAPAATRMHAVEEATQTMPSVSKAPWHDRGQQVSSHDRSPDSMPPRSNPSRRLSTDSRQFANESQRMSNDSHSPPRISNELRRFSNDSQRAAIDPQPGFNESRRFPNESRRLSNDTAPAQPRHERGGFVDEFSPPANTSNAGGSVWDKVEVEDLHRMIRSQDETIRRQQSEMEKMQLQLQIQGEGLRRHEEKSRNGSLTPSPPNVRFSHHGLAITPALAPVRTSNPVVDVRGRSPHASPHKSLADRWRDEGYRRKDPWQVAEPSLATGRPAMPAANSLDWAPEDRQRAVTVVPRPVAAHSPAPGFYASPGNGGVVSVETIGTARVGLLGGGSEREEEVLQAITRLTDGMLRRLENRLDGRVRDQVRQCVELERAALWGSDLTASNTSKLDSWGGDLSTAISTPVLHRPSTSLVNSLSYPRSSLSPPRSRNDSFARPGSDQGLRSRPPSSAWSMSAVGGERRSSPPGGSRSGRPPVSPQKVVIAECL